ncbi:SH3 domain-containing protein [Oceanibium sediminis]|uniref:SH3 domain-containing protein n=1 Tax=Oceanibium sediminis TaxID=2026339 RepID=UPI000DD3B9C9|nr:SH3 domain-containing protein [Oceanibium sediminis]
MRKALIAISMLAAVTAALPPGAMAEEQRGPVTNLPLPRYVSIKTGEANVRRGPGLTHRIDWVFQHRNLPVEITAEYGHWRRIRDIEGAGGWVHYSLLSGARYVQITADTTLHDSPDPQDRVVARAEAGAIARLGDCAPAWCEITSGGVGGWAPKTALWGVRDDEIRD